VIIINITHPLKSTGHVVSKPDFV